MYSQFTMHDQKNIKFGLLGRKTNVFTECCSPPHRVCGVEI